MHAKPHFEGQMMPTYAQKTLAATWYEVQLTPTSEETEWEYTIAHPQKTISPCRSSDSSESLASEVTPIVAVIGCGYVGSHLASGFGQHFRVKALDVSEARINKLRNDTTYPSQVTFTTDPNDLCEVSHFLIAVPTLVKPDGTVDDSYLKAAIKTVKSVAIRGSTVVIESSCAVGMSRALLKPIMMEMGLKGGMSPERIDPGRIEPPAHAIPKVVSGLDDIMAGSLDSILQIYSVVFDTVIPVSRPEVAEMTKLFENCQRMVLAAYANEMSDACKALDINPYEVTAACATKPFGYLSFTPSLGVGGHCIPVNPHYLFLNSEFPLLRAATKTTATRPARLAKEWLNRFTKQGILNPKVLVVGVSFKPGQTSLVNSPSMELMKALKGGAEVAFIDPLVSQQDVPWVERLDDTVAWNQAALNEHDLVVLAVRQPGLDYEVLDHLNVPVERFVC